MQMHSEQSEAGLQTELLQLWRRLLQNDAITLDEDFFDMGGDSLLGTELIAAIEHSTGRSIPESILFEASTVRKVVRRLLAPAEIKAKAIVEVGPLGDANPLLFFHGDWGDGGFYVKRFARVLAPFQPVVAVVPHGIGGENMPGTVEEMAQDRLPAILEYRPQGPYRLGGHCVGGMVALETARLLLSKGHDVEFVAMIDPIWTASGKPYPMLEGGTMRIVRLLPDDPASDSAEPIMFSPSEAPAEIDQKYEEALDKYRPAPVSVPIIAFTSAFEGRPWRHISRDFTLFEHVGDHYDWITCRAPQFATHLQACVGVRR
jgi:pimeloyl-ACP methyl ester carboxylesterase